ncbi:NAC domain-containing protein 60 [Linum grandiflorum]
MPVNSEISRRFYPDLYMLFWCKLAMQDKHLLFVAFPPPDDIKVYNMSVPWVVDLHGLWLSRFIDISQLLPVTMDAESSAQAALMERRMAYLASLNLSSGLKFCPTEKELIVDLLIPKIRRGDAVDKEDPIKEVDVYSVEPWDLWNRFSSDYEMVDLHFYTKLKRNSSGKIDREVAGGKGRWEGETDKSERLVDLTKQQVVTRRLKFQIRRFNYRNSENAEEDGRWIMIEYREKGPAASDLVIFRLRRNKEEAAGDGNLSPPSSGSPTASESGAPTASESGDSTCTDDDDAP